MINIQDLIPFMKDGWVAMDKNKDWHWFIRKPYIPAKEGTVCWAMRKTSPYNVAPLSRCLDIEPADDWTKSLIKVGEKMSELRIIPVTLERYNELFHNGEIDETALYKIVDDEELKQDD